MMLAGARSALVALGALTLAACRVEVGPPGGASRSDTEAHAPAEVWVYTSMYEHVIDAMKPQLAAALPDVRVEWVQAGSEKIAQRYEAEAAAGGARACVIATSDPNWYADLAARDALRPYVSPRAVLLARPPGPLAPVGRAVLLARRPELPPAWLTPTHQAFRVSLMVLAGRVGADGSVEAPDTVEALAEPAWRGRFSTPDPLSSGTMFTTLAALDAVKGRALLRQMRDNGWVAAGGSSAVLGRIQTGEKPAGLVLLENVLAQDGYPATGMPPAGLAAPAGTFAVPIPGYAAIPRGCAAPEAAERVVDWLFSEAGQAEVVRGRMHSPFPDAPVPDGARPLDGYALLQANGPALPMGARGPSGRESEPVNAAALRAFWAEGR